jgi:hypothetical protein
MEMTLAELWDSCWKGCFVCMENKIPTIENEQVAILWKKKLEKCRICKTEYMERLKRYEIIDPLERWANYTRKCLLCMLDDMSHIAETGDLEATSEYKKLLSQCIECMFRGFDEITEIRT